MSKIFFLVVGFLALIAPTTGTCLLRESTGSSLHNLRTTAVLLFLPGWRDSAFVGLANSMGW